MATSYGVSVQNKYSAFLEDEEGFVINSIAIKPVVAAKRAERQTTSGPNKKLTQSSSSTIKPSVLSIGKNVNGKPVGQKDHVQRGEDHKQRRNDSKRQRAVSGNQYQSASNNKHQHSANNNNYLVQAPNRQGVKQQGNFNQENNANNINFNHRFAKNQAPSSNNHQSNASQQLSKDNNISGKQNGKFLRNNNHSGNNQRPAGNRRPYFNNYGDNKRPQQTDENLTATQSSGPGLSLEEEKQRRQQKRVLDLKHKDPEKRDTRRQQSSTDQSSGEQTTDRIAQDNFKNYRRNGNGRGNFDESNRAFDRNLGVRGRGRRIPGGEQNGTVESTNNGQASFNRGPRSAADRPQRNRNGFETGSRGGHGPRYGEQSKYSRDSDKPKPIPNFSDKLDFPSLAP